MPQPGADQHQSCITIREAPDHPGSPPDLAIDPLKCVVGPQFGPVFAGKIFEASNHYYYTFNDLKEKVIACEYLKKRF